MNFIKEIIFIHFVCSVIFDGPVGEQTPPGDGSVELGEEGIHHLQKLQEIIRADPEKAYDLYEKFREILKEEKREDPFMDRQVEWEDDQMVESGFPASGSLKVRRKRSLRLRKVAKKKKKKVQTKKNQNRNQIGQKRLQKRKVKIERRSKKSQDGNSSKKKSKINELKSKKSNTIKSKGKKSKCKKSKGKKSKRKESKDKKQKSKKQAKTTRRRKNLKRRKQEGGRLPKKGKEGEKTKRLKKRGRERQCNIDVTACLTKVIFYARLNEKKATAISKQVKRIKDNDDIQMKKGNKTLDFNPTKDRLLSALGGNALNQTCRGKPFNSTLSNSTGQNAFSLETLTTLMACEVDIEEKCGNMITANASRLKELEVCETLADNFKTAFSKCFNASMSVEESCSCVKKINESDVASMQNCDVKDDNNAALKAKKSCKAAVGKCKNAAVAAVEGIDTCKEEQYSQATIAAATTTAATTTITNNLSNNNSSIINSNAFFEDIISNADRLIEVTCCFSNNTSKLATCGFGESCEGKCSAIDANLCPSGMCTGDPEDCEYNFEQEEDEDEAEESSTLSVATKPSSAFKWCTARCPVVEHKACCFNPVCFEKKSERCKWFSYLTGIAECFFEGHC